MGWVAGTVVSVSTTGAGWLIEVRMSNAGELAALMSAEDYDAFTAAEQQDEAIGP